jgi:hypothetical protein
MQSRNEPQSWWKWATTPPQSYGIYLAALVLMFVLSFYAGTLRPKGSTGVGPSSVQTPVAPKN